MSKHVYILLLIFCFNCKTIKISNKDYISTTQNILLASVLEKTSVNLKKEHTPLGFPDYQNPVKIQVSNLNFDKRSYNSYKRASLSQGKDFNVKYNDSLDNTASKFLNIKIADRVGLIKNLNSKANNDLSSFIQNRNNAVIVTSISAVFSTELNDAIINAEEIYLHQIGLKNYALNINEGKNKFKLINFNDGVVFGIETSSICWAENNRHQFEIVDLINLGKGCPQNSFRKVKHSKQGKNYKF